MSPICAPSHPNGAGSRTAIYRGNLPPKLVELKSMVVDASCTHLSAPGIRRHIQGAFAQGATIEERHCCVVDRWARG